MKWLIGFLLPSAFPRGEELRRALLAGLGTGVAIAGLSAIALAGGEPLLIAPFGAAAVVLFMAPELPPAQPRNLILANGFATFLALGAAQLPGPTLLIDALVVAVVVVAMGLTRTRHPPAGALAVLILILKPDWWFAIWPVGAGYLWLLVWALAFNSLIARRRYPNPDANGP
jgi:CBS-domain-containing membrane protein